jgi:hypothetical protein
MATTMTAGKDRLAKVQHCFKGWCCAAAVAAE